MKELTSIPWLMANFATRTATGPWNQREQVSVTARAGHAVHPRRIQGAVATQRFRRWPCPPATAPTPNTTATPGRGPPDGVPTRHRHSPGGGQRFAHRSSRRNCGRAMSWNSGAYLRMSLEWTETGVLTKARGLWGAGRAHGAGRSGEAFLPAARPSAPTRQSPPVPRLKTFSEVTPSSGLHEHLQSFHLWFVCVAHTLLLYKNHQVSPGPCGPVVRGSGVRSQVKGTHWAAGSSPGQGAERRQPVHVPVSHRRPSLPPSPSPSSL